MITGETMGRYVGELNTRKLAPGKYLVTGPRGSCLLTKATERVFVRSWARSRTVKRTVWNPSECTAPKTPWSDDPTRCWAFTLREAIDNLIPVLCSYRSAR